MKGKIREVEFKVQEKIIEKRLSDLEIRPKKFLAGSELIHFRTTLKPLAFDGLTSWTVFKTQFDVLTDPATIKKALESRFGDGHLTQFYRAELKTRRQKPGESLQVFIADVERLMSLAYAECPLDLRESLEAQYFVDIIRDEDAQHSTRLMNAKDLKSALTYSMKYEAVETASKFSRYARSCGIIAASGSISSCNCMQIGSALFVMSPINQ
ncbi:hypothetical protein AVEN_18129-1 [Araneus ventricosus]|uniref:Uncharacterized protein n=1 Tax=Araneus ventricosus TaxID=182803 RepID=A0A4Y2AJY1_ARAVE|nr:hypothetical protein AVEN_18129-1 [Araneus ventricosus]